MTTDLFEVRPIAGKIGAEVNGLDLRKINDNRTWDALQSAFLKHKVLAIRDQDLAPDDMMAISEKFGGPCDYPFVKGIDGYPYIFEIIKEPHETRNFGGGWHSDSSYMKQPPAATLLYALETPEVGGDTLFANTASAYAALSDGMKAMLNDLIACNNADLKASGGRSKHHGNIGGMAIHGTDEADQIVSEHPLIRTHPDTGAKAIYMNRGHTTHFKGFTEQESKPLIEFLQNHITQPAFTCRVTWQPGTVTLWDNRCTHHSAINDYDGYRRRMRRITMGAQTPA